MAQDELPTFPATMHHHTVRAKLNELVEEGEIDADEADEAYTNWRDNR